MDALAVILDAPKRMSLRSLDLNPVLDTDVVVETAWTGISTGTEKLLWTGEMPRFPGMGYPLVPGYESVGRIVDAGPSVKSRIGEWVFVPGANCYSEAKGLFGGTSKKLIVPSARALLISENLAERGILIALAATAVHACAGGALPELIVGHGVLGRLLARLTIALGAPAPVVWDNKAERRDGAQGYACIAPKDDDRHDYKTIYDVSGYAHGLDNLISRLDRHGEIVLGGFYADRLSFGFPSAFQAEVRLRVAAEWTAEDLVNAQNLIEAERLSLNGLITEVRPASDAERAYPAAFTEIDCLKMVLDWSSCE
jgi:3-hydroxyethyl bacteriochlorophyllide a dehydrogenase